MKHVINILTGKCEACGLTAQHAHKVQCRGTTQDNSDQEIRNQPRMQRAQNALEEAKQFTDKLKALGEELGFTVVEVNRPEELEEQNDSFADTVEAIQAFANYFNEGKAEQPFTLDEGQYDLLKLLIDHPMPTNHIGVLQLPFEHIEMMCVFKRNDFIVNRGPIGNSYWHVSSKGIDAINAYNKPKTVTLTIDQLCTLTHIYHAGTWDKDDVLEYSAEQDVCDLMDYGLVQYRRMTNDWVLTEAGFNHVHKILALTV